MAKELELKMDGHTVVAHEGETLLDAADRHDVRIPRLCALKGLSPFGACRMCMVEVTGVPRLLPACATQASEGMNVTIQSSRLQRYRRGVLELLFAERNHTCSVCVSSGDCELQSLAAQELGMDHTRFPYRYPAYDVDLSHERYGFDPNRCVLCTRCVRVCHEVEGARTWNVMGRGINSDVVIDLGIPWGESNTCTSCGKCVQVCPTGALFEKGKSVAEMKKRRDLLPCLR